MSLYVALAKNSCVLLAPIVGLRGLIPTEVRVGGSLIVRVAAPVLPADAAVMVTEPAATPDASPEL